MKGSSPDDPRHIGRQIDDLLGGASGGRRRVQERLTRRWLDAVDPEVSGVTRLEKFRDGVLTVAVASPAWLQELASFRKREILREINRDGERPVVRDIRFENGTFA